MRRLLEILARGKAIEFAMSHLYVDWVTLSLISKCSCKVRNGVQSIVFGVVLTLANSLAKYVRNIVDEVIWIKNSPPPQWKL